MPVSVTSPFVVSTLISPVTCDSSMASLTEFTSIRPEASASVTEPWIECSVMMPLPPRTLISPFTVSPLIGPWTPSTVISAYVPPRVSPIDCGTVISRSITEGAPSRLPVLTTTVLPTSETSTRPRRPTSPCTLTRFSFQAWTVIPPPKLLTERLAPAGTAKVVSVCLCDASASIAAASVATMSVLLRLGGDVVHTPQQLHLAPHRVGEVKVQVRVARVFLKRGTRLGNRPVDDGKVLPHDSHSRRVEATLILPERGLKVSDRRVGRACPARRRCHAALVQARRHWRRRVRRPLMHRDPHGATGHQHQRDAGGQELRDGKREAPGHLHPRGAMLRGQPSANARPQILVRLAVLERLRLRNHALQLTQRREACAARREMRIERSALGAVELAVEILREPVRPDVIHRSKCLRSAIRA